MNTDLEIGFMQGRLSPVVNGLIQSFPWTNWQQEFQLAESIGFGLMEWTIDQDRLYENPLLTLDGREKIRALSQEHGVNVNSLTGDCFMQAPFWKSDNKEHDDLLKDFVLVIESCAAVGISIVIIPLVDNGRLENSQQENMLVSDLQEMTELFLKHNIQVMFESDFSSSELLRFIERLDSTVFNINYDIGNSAALDFDPVEEIKVYGHRIGNVHIKDRVLGGTTVPLGEGAADFIKVFSALNEAQYKGKYILQTARANDDDHAGVLCKYREMVNDWLKLYGT